MRPRIDLKARKQVHVVGIGGPGMSAIALALLEMGHGVSGSDVHEGDVIRRLRGAGASISIGHDERLIDGCDAVTASSAIPSDNPEVRAARGVDGLFMTRAEMLASICAVKPTLAVAGTHGKTTTTSLLVHIFDEAGLQPNFVVGGDIKGLGRNARWSNSNWTIVEADESDGTHLELPLAGTVLTNIDVDHLDHYGDFQGIVDAFIRYLDGIEGPKVICCDDETLREISTNTADSSYIGYGASQDFRYRFEEIEAQGGLTRFRIVHGAKVHDIETSLRGLHNVSNITGAFALSVECGVDPEVCAQAIRSFAGVGRRFDLRGTFDGITLVDDYAHLPREIDAVLTAARTSGDGWRRIVAVFQPNRFNRMSRISHEYADAFRSADLVVVTDIYSSGTARIEGVTGHLVVDAVLNRHPDTPIVWVEERTLLAERVLDLLETGDVCISMGCGDIATLPDELLAMSRGDLDT